MAKILVIYASMTGNTEEMAEAIVRGVHDSGVEVVVKEATGACGAELLHYEGFIIGSYSWGDGELADEILDFYEELHDLDLRGKKAAVFGSGDTSYPIFCAAVDIIEEKLKQLGADIIAEGIKVEFNPSDTELEQCRTVGRQLGDLITAAC